MKAAGRRQSELLERLPSVMLVSLRARLSPNDIIVMCCCICDTGNSDLVYLNFPVASYRNTLALQTTRGVLALLLWSSWWSTEEWGRAPQEASGPSFSGGCGTWSVCGVFYPPASLLYDSSGSRMAGGGVASFKGYKSWYLEWGILRFQDRAAYGTLYPICGEKQCTALKIARLF